MLHIRWKCRFQLKNAAKSMENGQNMLQTVANTVENTMENERFELKTVAHTVEMAVSSSKMLQIAWKMVRTGNPKKNPQTKKKISPNNFLPLCLCLFHNYVLNVLCMCLDILGIINMSYECVLDILSSNFVLVFWCFCWFCCFWRNMPSRFSSFTTQNQLTRVFS